METEPFPAIFLSDIEYSVITSDVIKSFDCISKFFCKVSKYKDGPLTHGQSVHLYSAVYWKSLLVY